MSLHTTFAESYSQGQRATCKSSNYVDFRKEVQSNFTITNSELEFLLPKKAKCYIDKMNNDITCYTLENHPPYFFRRKVPVFNSLPQTTPQQGKRGNKEENTNEVLVPTLFALWRLPQLLPRATVPDALCHKLSSRTKPAPLFMAGVIVPDLPDQFVLQGAQYPPHFSQLLPNNFKSQSAREQVEQVEELANYDLENGTTTWVNSLPGMIAKQQQLYPSYYDSKSFDYLFKAKQLRAIYCESSPYCIGIGMVDDGGSESSIFSVNNGTEKDGYISPWSSSENLSVASVESIYGRTSITMTNNNKNNKKGNNTSSNTNNNISEDVIATTAQWPNPSPPLNATSVSAPFDINSFINDKSNDANLSQSYVVYNNNNNANSQTFLQLGQTVTALLTHSQTLSKQPPNAMNMLANICLNESNLAQVFPDMVNYTSSKKQPESLPNGEGNNDKFNVKVISSIFSTPCPPIGSASAHPRSADASLLTTPSMLKDTRPLAKGSSIVMLHTVNDHLSHCYRTQFPPEAFDWIKADECAIKPLPKYLMVTRCVLFLLRMAWLGSCVRPYIGFNRAPLVGSQNAAQPRVFCITPTTVPQILNKTYVDPIDAADRSRTNGNPEDGDDEEEIVEMDEDDEDEDVEYVYEDEDGEEEVIEQAVLSTTPSMTSTPSTTTHQKEASMGPSGICKSCYSARLEWGLIYSVMNLVEEFPCQLSDVTKHIRNTSNSPSCLTHIHSKFYDNAVNKQKNKRSQDNDAITVYCTCPRCINIQPNPTDRDITEIIAECICVQRPIDLVIGTANDSNYSKISQLIKVAEKLSWISTKPIKGIQVITAAGNSLIRADRVDKRMVQTTISNLSTHHQAVIDNANPLPNTPQQVIAPTITDGGNRAATVQVIHAVRYPREFRSLLSQVESYCAPIFYNSDRFLDKTAADKARNFDDLSDVIRSASKITPLLTNSSPEDNAKALISLYLALMADEEANYPANVRNAVLEYIRTKKLTVAIRGNIIIRNELDNNDHLPPIAKNILQRLANPSVGNDVHVDQQTGLYKGPITVTATKAAPPQQPTPDSDSSSGDNTDNSDGSDGEDDLLNAGFNKKGVQVSRKKGPTKVQRKAQAAIAAEKSIQNIAQGHKQRLHTQNQASLAQKVGEDTGKQSVDVYLCYDKVLYQALNLSPAQNYLFTEIDSYITKRLIPLSSLSNPILYDVDQLAQNTEFVTQLFDGALESPLNPRATKVLEGFNFLKQKAQSFTRVDFDKFVSAFKQFIAFKQTATNVEKAQTTKGTNTSAHQPKILIHAAQFRNTTITKVVGFELFGVLPKTVADDLRFKKSMSSAVSITDIQALKMKSKNQRLFPAAVSEKCLFMIEVQGDRSAAIAKYAAATLKIDDKNIFSVSAQGNSVSYAVINKQTQSHKKK